MGGWVGWGGIRLVGADRQVQDTINKHHTATIYRGCTHLEVRLGEGRVRLDEGAVVAAGRGEDAPTGKGPLEEVARVELPLDDEKLVGYGDGLGDVVRDDCLFVCLLGGGGVSGCGGVKEDALGLPRLSFWVIERRMSILI
jgi:hypothetical protein